MGYCLHFTAEMKSSPDATEPRAAEPAARFQVIARMIVIGFAIAAGFGVYLGMEFGWVTGVLVGWFGGNALALVLAYGWHRLDAARGARHNLGAQEEAPAAPAPVARAPVSRPRRVA